MRLKFFKTKASRSNRQQVAVGLIGSQLRDREVLNQYRIIRRNDFRNKIKYKRANLQIRDQLIIIVRFSDEQTRIGDEWSARASTRNQREPQLLALPATGRWQISPPADKLKVQVFEQDPPCLRTR